MKKKMLATIAASVALVGASFAATTKTEAAGVTCPTANVYQVKYTSTNIQDFEKWLKPGVLII
ncbi:sporulation protein, partial [Geobacillus stearothermophilus]